MTEKIVQGILDRFLTKYLKNVTTEHATVWGGQLVFKNVELRLDVLQEEVGLPVLFRRGFVQVRRHACARERRAATLVCACARQRVRACVCVCVCACLR